MVKLIITIVVLLSLWLWTFLPPNIKKQPDIFMQYKMARIGGHRKGH